MGDRTFSRAAYLSTARAASPTGRDTTARAEQQARETGKLDPLVDPKGFGVVRRSLPRLEQQKTGRKLWQLTVGTPLPIETRIDTTGSMGHNVDVAFRVMPNFFQSVGPMVSGYDIQIATGIFGDVKDSFPLCRPQFEMEAEKIVNQLTLMVPERKGGDPTEDPHYGIFAGAYLVSAYIHAIGLKSYDFTVSDANSRDCFDERQLDRIFGKEWLEKVNENGHQMSKSNLPDLRETVQDLLQNSHAFFLQVGNEGSTKRFWTEIFGSERVVRIPDTEMLPQVQATIIGLTEGTLELDDVVEFLRQNNISQVQAKKILAAVSNIPIGAQAVLPNFDRRPQKGNLFAAKPDVAAGTNLWPVDSEDLKDLGDDVEEDAEPEGWL